MADKAIIRKEPPDDWRKTPHQKWMESEGLPIVRGLSVANLRTIPVVPWDRIGARGTFVKLDGSETVNDAHVVEIPPRMSTKPQKHFFEALVYILSGRGATTVWNHRGQKQTFEWQAGTVFALPLNLFYQFHNVSGLEPARYVAVTDAPYYMNRIRNLDFIFGCDYDFGDRFSGGDDFYSKDGEAYTGRIWESNLVPDVLNVDLQPWPDRGAGGSNLYLEIGNVSLGAHISEFPVGTYKKAHWHGPGAHVIILSGEGYTLMWREGEERHQIDWQPGTLLVPPSRMFHQHFNVGASPARYMKLGFFSVRFRGPEIGHHPKSTRQGGSQIEYADQDPYIHRHFVEVCARHGVEVRMKDFVEA